MLENDQTYFKNLLKYVWSFFNFMKYEFCRWNLFPFNILSYLDLVQPLQLSQKKAPP